MPSTAELLSRIADVVKACTQGCAAAQHYEELSHLCDQALAEKGLKRSDLPQAAFGKLNGCAEDPKAVTDSNSSPLSAMRLA